ISLPDDQAVLLFQSVRELLMNVVKHSGKKEAIVSVDLPQPTELRIIVEDEGEGFDPSSLERQSRSSGFGLFSIRQRMEAMGGRLEIESGMGGGARLSLIVPHWQDAAKAPDDHASDQGKESIDKTLEPTAARSKSDRSAQSSSVQKSQTVRVLLVDDHAMVRQ